MRYLISYRGEDLGSLKEIAVRVDFLVPQILILANSGYIVVSVALFGGGKDNA